MTRRFHSCLLATVLFTAGCATVPRTPPPHPEEKSSVDALLLHTFELELTDEQVARFHDLDRVREVRAQDAMREMRATGALPMTPPRDSMSGMTQNGMNTGMDGMNGAGGMNGMANTTAGGMTPMNGQNVNATRSARRAQAAALVALEEKYDQLDIEAYFAAESLLTPKQKGPAQKFATAFREALFNWRQAMRAFRGR